MSWLGRIFDWFRYRSTPGDRSGPSEESDDTPVGTHSKRVPPIEPETCDHRLLRLQRKKHRKHMRRQHSG